MQIPAIAGLKRIFALVDRYNDTSLSFFRRKLGADETTNIPSDAFGRGESLEEYVGFELFTREFMPGVHQSNAQKVT